MRQTRVSRIRALLALANYLIGYQYLYPKLAVSLYKSLNFHFNAIWLEAVIYFLTFAVTLFLLWPAYQDGMKDLYPNMENNVRTVIIYYIILFGVTIASTLVVSLVFRMDTPENQQEVIDRMTENPWFYGFVAVVFGPVVEEGVFRECIVGQLKKEGYPQIGKIVSALLFGAVHLAGLLSSGSLAELPFILIYGSMGYVLADCYDRTGLILCPVLVHSINNLLGVLI